MDIAAVLRACPFLEELRLESCFNVSSLMDDLTAALSKATSLRVSFSSLTTDCNP